MSELQVTKPSVEVTFCSSVNDDVWHNLTGPNAFESWHFDAFVYTAALEAAFDTEDVRYDEPVVIDGWRPRNYDEGYRGAVTLRTAFALSINTVAASVGKEVGPGRVADVARRLGLANMPERNAFVPPSIALGSIETTLWDMTTAFAVFMDDGMRVDPHIVQRVTNSAGQELYARPPYTPQRVLDEAVAHRMNGMMGAVVLRGTGTGARIGDRDIAGKTGTSSDWRDAWFIGYSRDFTAGVWVGHNDFTSMGRTTGGTLPAQIWADSMRVAHQGVRTIRCPASSNPLTRRRKSKWRAFSMISPMRSVTTTARKATASRTLATFSTRCRHSRTSKAWR